MAAKKKPKPKAKQSKAKGKRKDKRAPKTDHLKPYQWKPGQSGNAGGRPSKKPITDAILAAMAEEPQQVRRIAKNLLKRAAKSDSSVVVVRDTVQGKPVQEVSGPDGGAIPVTVEGIDEALMKLLAAAEERRNENKSTA